MDDFKSPETTGEAILLIIRMMRDMLGRVILIEAKVNASLSVLRGRNVIGEDELSAIVELERTQLESKIEQHRLLAMLDTLPQRPPS